MHESHREREGEAQHPDHHDDRLREELARLAAKRVHDGAVPEKKELSIFSVSAQIFLLEKPLMPGVSLSPAAI